MMTTRYVPARPRTRRPRLRRVVAGVLIGAAAFTGIGALESAGQHPHHVPAVVVAHHERHHQAHVTPVAHAHKAGKHHLLRNAMLLHRLLRVRHVRYLFHPLRRHWILRRLFFRR